MERVNHNGNNDGSYVQSTEQLTKGLPKDVESGQEDASAETDKKGNMTPDHGRLLPLGQFLIVYACLSLAVLLTSLDQTVGECDTFFLP